MKRLFAVLLTAAVSTHVLGLSEFAGFHRLDEQARRGWQCGLKLCQCHLHQHSHGHEHGQDLLRPDSADASFLQQTSRHGGGTFSDTHALLFLLLQESRPVLSDHGSSLYPLQNLLPALLRDRRLDKPPQPHTPFRGLV